MNADWKKQADYPVTAKDRGGRAKPTRAIVVWAMIALLAVIVATGLAVSRFGRSPPDIRVATDHPIGRPSVSTRQDARLAPGQHSGREPEGGRMVSRTTEEPRYRSKTSILHSPVTAVVPHPVVKHDLAGLTVFDGIDPLSVIGRPFPVSRTITDFCTAELPRDDPTCGRVRDALDRLAEEPRDDTWAAHAEAVISVYVSQEPGEQVLKAVECRQTLCAAEIWSYVEIFNLGRFWGWTRHEDTGLSLVDYAHVAERTPRHEVLHAALLVVERR